MTQREADQFARHYLALNAIHGGEGINAWLTHKRGPVSDDDQERLIIALDALGDRLRLTPEQCARLGIADDNT